MEIYRYDSKSITGYRQVTVPDDYQIKTGELAQLPNPCYTPMKLDASGNLVSATLEESNKDAQNYIKNKGLNNSSISSDQQIATLSKEFAMTLQAQSKTNSSVLLEVAQLKKQVQDMQVQIAAQTSIDNSRATDTSSSTASAASPADTISSTTNTSSVTSPADTVSGVAGVSSTESSTSTTPSTATTTKEV